MKSSIKVQYQCFGLGLQVGYIYLKVLEDNTSATFLFVHLVIAQGYTRKQNLDNVLVLPKIKQEESSFTLNILWGKRIGQGVKYDTTFFTRTSPISTYISLTQRQMDLTLFGNDGHLDPVESQPMNDFHIILINNCNILFFINE